MENLKITIDGKTKEYPAGTTYAQIADEYRDAYGGEIAAVIVDGRIRELTKRPKRDCALTFALFGDSVGRKIYERTAIMLFIKAARDLGAVKGVVEFSVGNGLYCRLKDAPWKEAKKKEKDKALSAFAEKLEARMRKLVEEKLPITKASYPLDEAREIFSAQGMEDKLKLFRFRRSSSVNMYCLDGYYDYYYGYMLPNTSYLRGFRVIPYADGFMLLLPGKEDRGKVQPFAPREKLFSTLRAAADWSGYFGVETVGDLNVEICKGGMNDLILAQEAEQERRIGEIAKQIAQRKDVKFVLIAGPSSSGKTTFSHRLSIQLRTQGLSPHPIALDDYFVNREDNPVDENGNYDFECLEAMDVKLFNEDMLRLLSGEEVEMPDFNFKTGRREYRGKKLRLSAEDVLVIEGIHGLDPKMTYALPDESKFRVYISALTSLNVDAHNRIPTTDVRLLRRLVRDFRTRGASAQRTLSMWESVRRGEEKYIFPFQEDADVMFNSALIYELAVLKQYVEPLLFRIEQTEPEAIEAKRLLKFLAYFLGVDSENVPNNSICREFVGGSCFNV